MSLGADIQGGHRLTWMSARADIHVRAGGHQRDTDIFRSGGLNVTQALSCGLTSWQAVRRSGCPPSRADTVAGQLRDHDDREQFLAGVDLVLAGITGRRRAATTDSRRRRS